VIAATVDCAVARGFELAFRCALRIVEESAVRGVFGQRWGAPLIDGGPIRPGPTVGCGCAVDLVLAARSKRAGEAERNRLATRDVPTGPAGDPAEARAWEGREGAARFRRGDGPRPPPGGFTPATPGRAA
jgi:enoyl-CoA hydratase/carnithine racemase